MQAITADKNDQQSKLAGYIGSAVVHIILFALLWFIVIGPADPPLTDSGGGSGLSVSLGEPDMGGMSEVPVSDPAPQDPVPPQEQTETPVVVDETDNEPDAVVTQSQEVPKKTEPKKPVEKPVTKPVEKPAEKPREADKRSLFQRKTTTADGSGYGSGEKAGNQGAEDGNPDGDPNGSGSGYGTGGSGGGIGTGTGRGTGSGSGDGFSFELKGRGIQRKPNIEDKSKETGKVVVAIVVDRNGRVIKAMPNQRGTTNPKLGELAKQAAMETKFTPNPDAPDEQYGSITIEFKFRP